MSRIKIITSLLHLNEWLIFYPRLRRFYKREIGTAQPVVLDVGSNKGQTIDFFLGLFPSVRIYGFEPNNDLFKRLVSKYSDNTNISIANCGVSDQTGKLMFKETVTNETSTFEELNYDSEYLKMKSKVLGVTPDKIVKKTYEVDVLTLNNFITTNKIGQIDVIKIDTEGHEYKCLQGLFGSTPVSATFIQLEHHNDDMYSNKATSEMISELLAQNGYSLYATVRHGFGDFDELIYKKGK